MSILNERIKERRTSLCITLLQVAEFLGVTEATVQRYESGDIKNIKHETIAQLADLFHCNPAYLMGWTASPLIESQQQSRKSPSIDTLFQSLTECYQSLNQEGRSKLLEYAMDMSQLEKYQKDVGLKNA